MGESWGMVDPYQLFLPEPSVVIPRESSRSTRHASGLIGHQSEPLSLTALLLTSSCLNPLPLRCFPGALNRKSRAYEFYMEHYIQNDCFLFFKYLYIHTMWWINIDQLAMVPSFEKENQTHSLKKHHKQ